MVCANVNAEFGIARLTSESSFIVIMQQIVHEWMDRPEPLFLPSRTACLTCFSMARGNWIVNENPQHTQESTSKLHVKPFWADMNPGPSFFKFPPLCLQYIFTFLYSQTVTYSYC